MESWRNYVVRLSSLLVMGAILSACYAPIITPTQSEVVTEPVASEVVTLETEEPTLESTVTNILIPSPTPSLTPIPEPLFKLKVMTYNILYGAGIDPEFNNHDPTGNRYNRLIEFIKKSDPDVLGIQEAAGWDKGDPTIAEKFAEELGMSYYFAPVYPNQLHLMFLTKYEILETENYSPDIGRGAFRAAVRTPDGHVLNFFVMHLSSGHHNSPIIRMCQVKLLLPEIEKYSNGGTILMGDLNMSKTSPDLKPLYDDGWLLVGKSRPIDHIWVSPFADWKLESDWYEPNITNITSFYYKISDHQPVTAEIGFYSPMYPTDILSSTTTIPFDLAQPPIDMLEEVEAHKFYDFADRCDLLRWVSWSDGTIENGKYILIGEEYWESGARLNKTFQDGEAVMIRFQYSPHSEINIKFDNMEEWKTKEYKRFGISIRGNEIQSDIYQGPNYIGGKSLNLGQFTSDTVYNLLLAIGNNGKFVALLWNPNEPDNTVMYERELGEDWSNLNWSFGISSNKGQIAIENITQMTFTDFDL